MCQLQFRPQGASHLRPCVSAWVLCCLDVEEGLGEAEGPPAPAVPPH